MSVRRTEKRMSAYNSAKINLETHIRTKKNCRSGGWAEDKQWKEKVKKSRVAEQKKIANEQKRDSAKLKPVSKSRKKDTRKISKNHR